MIVYPNAKVNIGLNVLKKKANGYHKLSSIFYPLNELCDILEILPSKEFSFSSSGISIPGNSNICVKAFELLKADFEIENVAMHLHKQVPIGAGLGGGSADGAFALKALNEIFNLELSIIELEEYALNLGADCPFFIDNIPKYVKGIGEKMNTIDLDLSCYEIRLLNPKIHISTKESYSEVVPQIPELSVEEIIKFPIKEWKSKLKNDFEVSAFAKYPELVKIKKKFYEDGAIYSSMTGSGSVVYGMFEK